MRAWPRDLSGLKLQLAPGWYPLASYMPATELRRLLDLLEGLKDGALFAGVCTWSARIVEQLVQYASGLAASGSAEHVDELFAAARLLAGDDEKQLAWIDSQAALHDAPDTQDAPS